MTCVNQVDARFASTSCYPFSLTPGNTAVFCGHGLGVGHRALLGRERLTAEEIKELWPVGQGQLKVRHKAAGAAMLVPVLSGLLSSLGPAFCQC
jgi:hypothetical protein